MNSTVEAGVGIGSPIWLNMQVLSGSLSVMLISSLAGATFFVGRQIWQYFYHTFMISLDFTNREEAYDWIMQWCATYNTTTKGKAFLSAQNMSLNVKKNNDEGTWWRHNNEQEEKPELEFHLGYGLHAFWYKGNLIWLTRNVEGNPLTTGWNNKPFQLERIHLSCYGRDRNIFRSLITEARDQFYSKDQDNTKIYIISEWGASWRCVLTKPRRSVDSVILDGTISNQLLEDAAEFLANKQWYSDHGIPYRRGYLLHGPPGTGKSSFAQALAGHLKFCICVLSLSNPSLTDQDLNSCLHNAPKKSVILLEDVDAVFVDRNIVSQEKGSRGGISFSGLLNAIDGVASQEGRILVMTTNHIERLDPALIRPGRCDVKIRLSYASRHQIFRMFLNMYGREYESLASKFADLIPANALSMAQLQSFFLTHRKDPKEAMVNYKALVKLADETTGYGKGTDNEVKDQSKLDGKIASWLKRLGLSPYIKLFDAHRLIYISDIKHFVPSELCTLVGITHPSHIKIVQNMMTGSSEEVVFKFSMASKADLRNCFIRLHPELPNFADEFSNLFELNKVSIHEVETYLSFFPDDPAGALKYFKAYQEGDLVLSLEEKLEEPLETWLRSFAPIQTTDSAPAVIPDINIWLSDVMKIDNAADIIVKLKEERIETLEQIVLMSESGFSWEKFGVDKDGIKWKLDKEIKAMNEKLKKKSVVEALCDPDKGLKKLGQIVDMDDRTLSMLGVHNAFIRYAMLREFEQLRKFKTAQRFCLRTNPLGTGKPVDTRFSTFETKCSG